MIKVSCGVSGMSRYARYRAGEYFIGTYGFHSLARDTLKSKVTGISTPTEGDILKLTDGNRCINTDRGKQTDHTDRGKQTYQH